MPIDAALLFEDETLLRLFPVLRRAWALRGEQARIGISGRNAKRVLFGAINPVLRQNLARLEFQQLGGSDYTVLTVVICDGCEAFGVGMRFWRRTSGRRLSRPDCGYASDSASELQNESRSDIWTVRGPACSPC